MKDGDKPSGFRLNGVMLTNDEREAWSKSNREKHDRQLSEMFQSRVAPRGHMPHWGGGGHTSLAAAVPAAQAAEHAEFCRKEGLTGVEVQRDGTIVTNSPTSREKYLKARGFADHSTAGSDTRIARDRQVDPREARKNHKYVTLKKK